MVISVSGQIDEMEPNHYSKQQWTPLLKFILVPQVLEEAASDSQELNVQ